MFVQSKVRLKYILITCDLFWGRIPLPSLQGRDLAGIYLPRGRSGMHARGVSNLVDIPLKRRAFKSATSNPQFHPRKVMDEPLLLTRHAGPSLSFRQCSKRGRLGLVRLVTSFKNKSGCPLSRIMMLFT